jgi:putative peptidoglycan lipid II flippase
MAWVVVFVFIGKVAGALKEMAVAWRYGTGQEVDAYLFVSNLVSWPLAVWLSLLTSVLVPAWARTRSAGEAELSRFRSELLAFSIGLGIALWALASRGLPLVLASSWAGLPEGTERVAQAMTPALSSLLAMGIVISLFSAWMLAAGRHLNTLFEGIPALVLLIAVLAWPRGGIEPLIWGTVIGYMVHLLSLAGAVGRSGDLSAPRFRMQSPQWVGFWRGFSVMLAGQALMSVTTVIDQFFAAHLGTGAIATLGYANRILVLVLSLGATAVTRATLPVFSRTQGQEPGRLRHMAMHWVRILGALGIIGGLLGWWLAPTMVHLLFERGAFTSTDAAAVTHILRFGLGQLPFYFASLVLVSMLTSQLRYAAICVVAIVNVLVKLVANSVFVPTFGVSGLMISTTVMLAVSCLLLGGVAYARKLPGGSSTA